MLLILFLIVCPTREIKCYEIFPTKILQNEREIHNFLVFVSSTDCFKAEQCQLFIDFVGMFPLIESYCRFVVHKAKESLTLSEFFGSPLNNVEPPSPKSCPNYVDNERPFLSWISQHEKWEHTLKTEQSIQCHLI